MAAAVADYAPEPVEGKRPKTGEPWELSAAADRGRPRRARRARRTGRCSSASAPRRARRASSASAGCSPRSTSTWSSSTTSRAPTSASTRPTTRSCSSPPAGERTVGEGAEGADRRRDPRRGRAAASSEPAASCEPAGLLERGDPRLERRVRVEQRPLERGADARRLVQRVLDVEVRDGARSRASSAVVSIWSLRSASASPSPSPVISAADASARYSRRRETASWISTPAIGAISERGEAERERDQARRCRSAPAAAAEERDPQQEVGEERDHADEHGDERHQADVAVADVRDLVRDHALELALVHQVQQAGGDADVGLVRAAAGGERVRRRVVDDVDRRRLGEAGGDRDRLDHVEEPRVLRPVGRLGAGRAGDDRCRPRAS